MSRQQASRRGENEIARSAGFVAAKGAGLIAIAVILGIVLLQIVDDGTTGPVGDGGDDDGVATTTTEPVDESTTTTTAPLEPETSPEELAIVVLNAGAPSGSAASMEEGLAAKGYTNTPEDANDWSGASRTGNTVFCREGFDREAATLAIAVGEGTTTEPFPDPAPPFSDQADCVVAVGASA